MTKERKSHPIRALFGLIRRLFLLACVLVAGLGVAGYAAGWVRFEHDRQREKATIELETGEAKRAAQEVFEKAQEAVGAAGSEEEGRQEAGDKTGRPVNSAAAATHVDE
jgi:hypothetical protein